MSDVAAFLVILDKRVCLETAVATMDACRQFKGVIGIRTIYDDTGAEIKLTRGIVDGLRDDLLNDRLRIAADVARDVGA